MEETSLQPTITEPTVPSQQVVPNTVEAPIAIQKKSPWLIIVSGLLVITLAIAGYLYWQMNSFKAKLASQHSPSPSPVVSADPTANWQTYTDSKNGISFKYPSEWTYKVGDTNATTAHVSFDTNMPSGNKNTNYIFEVTFETENNFNQWSKYETTTTLESQTVNGIIFEKYITGDLYSSLNYILKQNDKIVRFLIYPYDASQYPVKLKNNIDQILSTFKFINIENQTDDTAIRQQVIAYLVATGLDGKQLKITAITELGNQANVYSVSYVSDPTTNGDGTYLLIGKVNNEWIIPKSGDKTYCSWIKNAGLDEATVAFMGSSCQ